MICPKCGSSNMDGVTFCGACGTQLKTIEAPAYQPTQQSKAQQFGSPYGGPSNGGLVVPKNYMTEAIIVTVISFFCCGSVISLILGIIAIVKASNVTTKFQMGLINEAVQEADSAKKLTIWAAVIAAVWAIIIIVLYIMGIAAIIGLAELSAA